MSVSGHPRSKPYGYYVLLSTGILVYQTAYRMVWLLTTRIGGSYFQVGFFNDRTICMCPYMYDEMISDCRMKIRIHFVRTLYVAVHCI